MLARDHYATLGLPPNASTAEVEQAYKHLCRRYHPDINPGDPHAAAVFDRIQIAYGILSNADTRERYDREGAPSEHHDHDHPGLNVRLLPEAAGGGSWRELFELLREHRRRSVGARGDDVHATIRVPLEHVERGRRTSIAVRRRVTCDPCGGRGRVELQSTSPCARCQGSGEEAFVKGALAIRCVCADCAGVGLVSGIACPDCRGHGHAEQTERILVRVPPGVGDGYAVRLRRRGNAGIGGGEPGDLVVRCVIDSPQGVRRAGPNLHVSLPISVAEAVLGARIDLPTIEGGAATLRVPPGTQSGTELRVRGKGLELPDGRRGDMLVRVEIHIPRSRDEETRELARQMAARDPLGPRG